MNPIQTTYNIQYELDIYFNYASATNKNRPETHLILKQRTKIAADDTLFFYFYFSKEIRLEVSCESSA